MYEESRGVSTAVSYTFILVIVISTAAASLYVVDGVNTSIDSPSPETADFGIDRTVDGNYSLIYAGKKNLNVDNTAAIVVTNQENTTVLTPENWVYDEDKGVVNNGDKIINDLSKGGKFSTGERIQIIHYESGAVNNGSVVSDSSGEVIDEMTIRQSNRETLEKIESGNYSDIGSGVDNGGGGSGSGTVDFVVS